MFWSKASLLAALLAASTDAFVTPSPRRGVASFGGVATRQPLFVASEETAEETVAPEEVVEEVAEDAVAAATEVAEEVAAVVEEVAASSEDDEEKRSVVRPRHTIFVGNLPFGTYLWNQMNPRMN